MNKLFIVTAIAVSITTGAHAQLAPPPMTYLQPDAQQVPISPPQYTYEPIQVPAYNPPVPTYSPTVASPAPYAPAYEQQQPQPMEDQQSVNGIPIDTLVQIPGISPHLNPGYTGGNR